MDAEQLSARVRPGQHLNQPVNDPTSGPLKLRTQLVHPFNRVRMNGNRHVHSAPVRHHARQSILCRILSCHCFPLCCYDLQRPHHTTMYTDVNTPRVMARPDNEHSVNCPHFRHTTSAMIPSESVTLNAPVNASLLHNRHTPSRHNQPQLSTHLSTYPNRPDHVFAATCAVFHQNRPDQPLPGGERTSRFFPLRPRDNAHPLAKRDLPFLQVTIGSSEHPSPAMPCRTTLALLGHTRAPDTERRLDSNPSPFRDLATTRILRRHFYPLWLDFVHHKPILTRSPAPDARPGLSRKGSTARPSG